MDPLVIGTIVIPAILAFCAIVGFVVAYIQWRENHSDRSNSRLKSTIKQVILDENKNIELQLTDHTSRLTQSGDRLGRIESMLKDMFTEQRSANDKITQMEVKVGLYWSSLEQTAMNAAKTLHQPDPARAHIDKLLEAFMEGTLTTAERIELRKVLVIIRNYEPNGTQQLDFPVHPGEQTAAAILLSTMDLVDPTRMASLGHAEHRNHRSTSDLTNDSE